MSRTDVFIKPLKLKFQAFLEHENIIIGNNENLKSISYL